jgi:hypothetical protein
MNFAKQSLPLFFIIEPDSKKRKYVLILNPKTYSNDETHMMIIRFVIGRQGGFTYE